MSSQRPLFTSAARLASRLYFESNSAFHLFSSIDRRIDPDCDTFAPGAAISNEQRSYSACGSMYQFSNLIVPENLV